MAIETKCVYIYANKQCRGCSGVDTSCQNYTTLDQRIAEVKVEIEAEKGASLGR